MTLLQSIHSIQVLAMNSNFACAALCELSHPSQEHLNAKREAYDKVRGVFDKAEAARKAIAAAVKAEQECKDALTAAKRFSSESADLLSNPPHKVREVDPPAMQCKFQWSRTSVLRVQASEATTDWLGHSSLSFGNCRTPLPACN